MSSILDASKDISSCANLLSVILTFRSSGLIESSSLARALRGAPTRLHSSSRCCENPSKTVRVAPSNFLRTRSSRSRNCARLSASADKSPPDVEAPSRVQGIPSQFACRETDAYVSQYSVRKTREDVFRRRAGARVSMWEHGSSDARDESDPRSLDPRSCTRLCDNACDRSIKYTPDRRKRISTIYIT